MAEVVSELPALKDSGSKYAKFLDGQVWKVDPQEYGLESPKQIVNRIITALRPVAAKQGKRMVTRTLDGYAYFTAVPVVAGVKKDK